MAPPSHSTYHKRNAGVTKHKSQYKVSKSKTKLIHNARIKMEYHKLLRREGMLDETAGESNVEDDREKKEPKLPSQEAAWMEASGSNGHVESNFKSKSKSNKAKHQNSHKPNPFLALHQLAVQQREEKRAAIEAAKKEREEKKQKREKYYADRNRTKKMLNERTGRGQPVMKNVVDVLLEKIKKGS